jgi:hypothetical protein
MEQLHWELSVLSRAVAYPNLTAASTHVGLSQPQLSRIIARIEKTINVVVLDREAKRKSGWTKAAFDLAVLYSRFSRDLDGALQQLAGNSYPTSLRVGTLEGLVDLAIDFCEHGFLVEPLKSIELDVYDLDSLEEEFQKDNLDFIFTFQSPGKKKFRYESLLGYQTMDEFKAGDEYQVMSLFEFGTSRGKNRSVGKHRLLVSNSLEVRRRWLNRVGGRGLLPSKIHRNPIPRSKEAPVLLLAHDDLNPKFWQAISRDFAKSFSAK